MGNNSQEAVLESAKVTKQSKSDTLLVQFRTVRPLFTGAKHIICPVKVANSNSFKSGEVTPQYFETDLKNKFPEFRNESYYNFYRNQKLVISQNIINLDPSNIKDWITIEWLKQLKDVAIGEENYNPSVHKYILTDIVQVAQKKVNKTEAKIEAFEIYKTLSEVEIKNILLWGYGKNTENTNYTLVKELILDYIENDPAKFVRLNKDSHKALKIKIAQAVQLGILTKKGGAYFLGDTMIGTDEVSAVQYLMEPKNSETKKNILQEVESKGK